MVLLHARGYPITTLMLVLLLHFNIKLSIITVMFKDSQDPKSEILEPPRSTVLHPESRSFSDFKAGRERWRSSLAVEWPAELL